MTLEDRLAQADAKHAKQERLRDTYRAAVSRMDSAARYLADLIADGDDQLVLAAVARYRQYRTAYQEARAAYLGQPA